jgi:molecular chaperone DnaK (HSP70)
MPPRHLDITTMPPPQLSCPNCKSLVSGSDQYCGVCGTVLARLRWSTPEEEGWHSGDGNVAVRAGARSAGVRFRNEGVVPAGLVLRAEDVSGLPDWVDHEALGEKILVVPPSSGETDFTELTIPLVPARLAPLFEVQEDAVPSDLQREAHLPFLTNLNELRDGRWTSRPFKLTLLAARKPWVSPACSFYRFLPVERLAGEGVEHRIALHNETAQALDLTEIQITDDPESGPPGYVRLQPDAIVHRDPLDRQRVEAGATWSDVLRLSIPGLPSEALGWFSVLVEYLGESADGRERHRVGCRVQGRVGRGPTLLVMGPSALAIPLERVREEHSLALENPGQIPVAVEAFEILRERHGEEEPAPERDWLSLTGLVSGDVLEPGEVRTLSIRLQPSLRPRDELNIADSQRRIRIRHDGLPRPAQLLELEVSAYFGRAEVFTAGIDFGTTNSVVCIGGPDRAYALQLETGLDCQSDRIRSLMYFESNAPGNQDERFVYGDEAFSSAAIRPENLVRSIKTVVARDPETRYVFYKRTAGLKRVTKTPQDLLNLFISELRSRAEFGVNHLPVDAYRDLELEIGTQIVLSQAVFSHPVAITQEARRALMEAAHGAGINESVREVEDFFEQSCIDEATAAVLAYVQGRVQDPPILDAPRTDCERVLCFDMGGGTTDLATVEVLQMASFLTDPTGNTRVVVNLEAKGGARLGGDDLDEMLAGMILAEVQQQSEAQGAPVLLEDLQRAIRSRSYSDFKTAFQLRRGARAGQESSAGETKTEDEALALYKLATEILAKAEEAKRKLSSSTNGEVIDLPGTGWPRQRSDTQAAAANFEIVLQRAEFESQVRERVKAHLPLLDRVVSGAGWEWPSVTTLLFTGQSSRIPVIREEVSGYVAERRGTDAPPLLRIEPGLARFDPKNCVAIGAAIWGVNRNNGSWLEIHNRVRERLTFDLETRIGPRFRPVPGLQKGQTLPAKGAISVHKGTTELKLYRDGNKEHHVRFRFPPVREEGELTVRVKGLSDYAVVVDGEEIKGEVRS